MFQGPIALRDTEGSLEVAICVDGDVSRISGLERGRSTSQQWTEFWSLDTQQSVSPGTTFVAGAPGSNGAEVFNTPTLAPGSELDIAFFDGDETIASAVFRIPSEGAPADDWLQPDGTTSSSACPD
ncbi:hypothetical protein FHX48_000641 [Microbacterium halimionae]|uniref:Uncharacterized protein n=1 Tax=Microbacterium halimionae TaxID=1526413 RepID=A0A7W3JMG7_9MICO|nr:hypothetical protein [Microbacterium halimionae]MBA8815589.1 hypothetical protein [Microbacterium halimionae]NII95635.1 hypothetical protein [Microbacterium halimionae]